MNISDVPVGELPDQVTDNTQLPRSNEENILGTVHLVILGFIGGIFVTAIIIVVVTKFKEKRRKERIRSVPIQTLMREYCQYK